jgi:hypothetical protein
MTDQHEALRLADALEKDHLHTIALDMDSAAELRRLHAEVERLRAALTTMLSVYDRHDNFMEQFALRQARAALKEKP